MDGFKIFLLVVQGLMILALFIWIVLILFFPHKVKFFIFIIMGILVLDQAFLGIAGGFAESLIYLILHSFHILTL